MTKRTIQHRTDEQIQELRAAENVYGWHVIDLAGGVWWPDDDADEEINASDDPARTARRICDEQPMRGKWYD